MAFVRASLVYAQTAYREARIPIYFYSVESI